MSSCCRSISAGSSVSREQLDHARTLLAPAGTVVEIPENDPLFHVVHDLDERVQIPSIGVLYRGVTYERDGVTVYKSEARFTAPGRVEVDGARLESGRIILATGSDPALAKSSTALT